jgi:hypothetical protein
VGCRRALLRSLVWFVCVSASCGALLLLALDGDELTLPIVIMAGAQLILVLSILLPRTPRPQEFSASASAAVAPVVSSLLVELVVGFALYPVTIKVDTEPDPSWFGVVTAVVLLIVLSSALLAVVGYLLILSPILVIALDLRPALRGDGPSRVSVVFSLVVITFVAAVTASVLVVESPEVGRLRLIGVAEVLLGTTGPEVGTPGWLLWTARALTVVLVSLIVICWQVARRHPTADRPWSATDGVRPPAAWPR